MRIAFPAAVLASAAGAAAQPSFTWRCGSGWYAVCHHPEMCGGPTPTMVADNGWYMGSCAAPAPFPYFGDSPVISPVEPGKQMVQINPGEHTSVDHITLDSSFLPATLRIAADVALQTGGAFDGTVEFFGSTAGLYNADQDPMTLEFFGPLRFLSAFGVGLGTHAAVTTHSDVLWASGSITLNGGLTVPSTWLNLGVMTVTGDGQFTGGPNATFFLNENTFRKTLATGETQFIGAALVNTPTGLVDIASGVLSLEGGGQSAGAWNIGPGAEVRVQQPYMMNNGTIVQGDGYARVTNGPLTVEGQVSIDNFSLEKISGFSPTVNGTGELRVLEDMTWKGGRVEGSGITRIMPGATMTLPPSEDRALNDRLIHNQGAIHWSGSGVAGSGWTLVNDGPMIVTADDTLSGHPAGALLVNTSIIRKDSPGTTRIFRVAYETGPASSIEVEQGVLTIDGVEWSGQSSGDWIVHAGAVLEFGQGVHNLLPGTNFPAPAGGQGPVRITHGTVNLDDPGLLVTLQTLDMATPQAKIGGTGDLTVTDTFLWQGGELATTGTVIAGPGVTVDAAAPGQRTVTSGTFRNQGNILAAGNFALTLADGAVVHNATSASWEIDGNGTITSAGTGGSILNHGYFHRAAGAGEFQIQPAFHNGDNGMGNSGEVRISSGFVRFMGAFTQDRGRLIFENDAQAAFTPHLDPGLGSVEGNGTILGSAVVEFANIHPGNVPGAQVGRLAIAGSLTMDTGQAALSIDIGGTLPGEHDRLEVAGPASISGELRLELHGFVPEDGQEFTVMTSPSGITGQFDLVLQPFTMPAGLKFAALYPGDAVVLRVVRTCYPDCTLDGALTVGDFGCFQTQFVSGHPSADCNGDGSLTVADFGCMQSRFVVGCP